MTASWILVGRGTTVVAVLMHLIQPFAQLSTIILQIFVAVLMHLIQPFAQLSTIILQIFSSHFSIADRFTQLSS